MVPKARRPRKAYEDKRTDCPDERPWDGILVAFRSERANRDISPMK